MKKDISTIDDIKLLVDAFYTRVQENSLLSGVFNERILDRWPSHLEKMYRFWQTVLLDEHTYNGSPFTPHARLPVNETHFEKWKELFYQTVDENFAGDKAEEAKWRAGKMAEMFYHKITYYQNNPDKILL
ncbi:MAG: group III truncated hemoglobin [Bacteroidetes bacterium]|nr:group III truncated hemoglobin [Bacteroidota bacterium]